MTDRRTEAGGPIATRWSAAADDRGLADVHRAAWRYAYAGIIPGLTLERMIARRGPAWWSRMHERGFRALVVDCDGTLAGYATLGRSRGAGSGGTLGRNLRALPAAGVPGLRARPPPLRRGPPQAGRARPRPADGLGAQRERDRLPLLPRHGRHRGRRGPRTASAACRSTRPASPGAEAAHCSPAGSTTPLGQPGVTGSAARIRPATGVSGRDRALRG